MLNLHIETYTSEHFEKCFIGVVLCTKQVYRNTWLLLTGIGNTNSYITTGIGNTNSYITTGIGNTNSYITTE